MVKKKNAKATTTAKGAANFRMGQFPSTQPSAFQNSAYMTQLSLGQAKAGRSTLGPSVSN